MVWWRGDEADWKVRSVGIEIDSLCDMISFMALPVVLLMTQRSWERPHVWLSSVRAAVTRLHFNRWAKHDEGSVYFIGLPVTSVPSL